MKPKRVNTLGGGRKKAAVVVAKTIVSEIQRLGLKPGDKLISEDKAVARYGVARGTMREALRFLELQGALRIRSGPGGGPVVTRPGSEALASTLSLILQFADVPFRSIIEARHVMEPGLAAMAAQNASPSDLETLHQCLATLADAVGNDEAFQAENRRFHDLVAAASGNLVLAHLIPALHWISDGIVIRYTARRRKEILRKKTEILKAIEAEDPEAAQREMATLIESALRDFDNHQPDVAKSRVSWVAPGEIGGIGKPER